MNINDEITADVFGITRTGIVQQIDKEYITIEWDWAPPNYDAYEGIYKKEELKEVLIK